jgi:hypothetical protein
MFCYQLEINEICEQNQAAALGVKEERSVNIVIVKKKRNDLKVG